jgi:nanoRNase/pAp phosphatase (c-di-AMP/oligoRNAs hydrolase)
MPEEEPGVVPEIAKKLGEVLPSRGRVYIIPHNYPDPDALASAAGIHLLLSRQFRLNGQILFSGTVSRSENRELLRQFRYKWGLSSQESRPSRPVPCILVDTSPWSGNVTIPEFARPVAVIDHHQLRRRSKSGDSLFADIRSGTGATCTMVHEYLEACAVSVPKWLATIMAYAIATETLDLSRDCSEEDLSAYMTLLNGANLANLGRIRHAPLPRSYYANLQEAMQNAYVYGRVAWTYLSCVRQPEIVAEVADLLHRMERVTWAFCLAHSNGRLLVSLRSSDPRARCGWLLRAHLGPHGSAGGHHHMAAGYIPLDGEASGDAESVSQALIRALVSAIEIRGPGPSGRPRAGDGEPIAAQRLVDLAEPPPDGEDRLTASS